jgi:hypothetical protein
VKPIIQQIKEVDREHLEEKFTRDRETSSQLEPSGTSERKT